MPPSAPITLSRTCDAIEIPSGNRCTLTAGAIVRVMQFLGNSFTVANDYGAMFRIDAKDADAMGLSNPETRQTSSEQAQPFSEKLVWDQLKTIFDPEIPVNVVDLGLIYSCAIADVEQSGRRLDIKMAMTAPGCGMAGVLKADVEAKLSRLPGVKEVHVEVVFDPPWSPARMSDAVKLQLGFDLDYGAPQSQLPIVPSKS
jgi:probable FeS assembly SUF system protein SufT